MKLFKKKENAEIEKKIKTELLKVEYNKHVPFMTKEKVECECGFTVFYDYVKCPACEKERKDLKE